MLKISVSVLVFIIICATSVLLYVFYKPSTNIEINSHREKIKTTILGAIVSPGIYYVEPKKTLKTLIFKAGGLEDYAMIKDIDFNLVLKPNSEYTIEMDESRIQKQNLNALVDSNTLKDIVKTRIISTKVTESIVNYINRFGKYDYWEEVDNIEGVGEKTLKALQKFFFII